jgi:hypothetical protein
LERTRAQEIGDADLGGEAATECPRYALRRRHSAGKTVIDLSDRLQRTAVASAFLTWADRLVLPERALDLGHEIGKTVNG